MQIKLVKSDIEAQEALLAGSKLMSDIIGSSIGPRGLNSSIERIYGTPMVIHDGFRIISQLAGENTFLDNQWENMGAKLVYKAAKETVDSVGDGTSATCVLTHAILAEGYKLVAAGHNSRMLRRGILAAIDELNKELTKLAKPVKTDAEKEQVATISAQDEKIGKAIAAAVKIVGDDGVITVDEIGQDLSIDYKEGMQFDQGLIDRIWITDFKRGEAVLDNPVILVTDQTISEVSQIEIMLEQVVGTAKKGQVLILAKDITGSALMFLAQNKTQNGFNLVPVKAPGVGDDQAEYLQDIATLVGAKLISEKAGDQLNEVEIDDLGTADRVTIGDKSTIIVKGHGIKEDVDTRVASIKEQLKRTDVNDYQKERLRERLSKLTNGIAIIHVGDDAERKEQVLDAISATKAAIAEGIVPGGETAYLRAAAQIKPDALDFLTLEEKWGAEIVYTAIKSPFKYLIENSGDDAGAILDKVLSGIQGYNVLTREMCDLIEEGIIDPVKVCKTALYNAGQVATSMLTIGHLIGIKRIEKDNDTQRA